MTDPKALPLQLQGLVFTRSVVVAVPGHQADERIDGPMQPENSLSVGLAPDVPGRYVVTMRSSFNRDSHTAYPYMIDMECLAIFTVLEGVTDEEARRAAAIIGHQVAYGAIRESVMWLTSRQPYGPFLLGISVLSATNE